MTVVRIARATVTADATALDARMIPWDEPAEVSDDGRTTYTETWQQGSLVPADRVIAYTTHKPGHLDRDGRTPIGVVSEFRDEPDGLYGRVTLGTARGRDIFELAQLLGTIDVSIEADSPPHTGGGTVTRTADTPVTLTGLAVIEPPARGAFAGATATAARTATEPDDEPDPDEEKEEDEEMSDTDTMTAETEPIGRAEVAEMVRTQVAALGRGAPSRAPATPLHRYQTFDEAVTAFRTAPRSEASELSAALSAAYRAHVDYRRDTNLVGRAWIDQITTANPGLMPPTYLTQIFGVIDLARPGITALGTSSAGSSGMTIHWPTFSGDLRTIVGVQATEKTAITSVLVSFGDQYATLKTFAGGSDVSYQLARRSSPSYMAAYERILNSAFGIATEIDFETALAAVNATANHSLDLTADTDGADTKAVLFKASSEVRTATGTPATVVLAASDVFAYLGGQAWLQAPQYGTQNTPGTTSASTLQISISGLTITEAPDLPDGVMIVTNESAATWFEEGPFFVSAEDVQRLGTDVAIWGMGCPGILQPGGIREIAVDVTPGVTTARAAKKS